MEIPGNWHVCAIAMCRNCGSISLQDLVGDYQTTDPGGFALYNLGIHQTTGLGMAIAVLTDCHNSADCEESDRPSLVGHELGLEG